MIKFCLINPRFFIFIILSAFLIEISGFILIGKEIGILITLGLVVLTTIIGSSILRTQGINFLKNVQHDLLQERTSKNCVDTIVIIGAILLILPGFVSDIIGVLFIIKPINTVIWHFFLSFRKKNYFYNKDKARAKNKSEKIIDLQAEDYHIHGVKESPWRRDDNDHHNFKRF
ncbi:FxsA family protein [Bartonella sp. B41]